LSVRRLATQQPETFAFTPASAEMARWWMAKYPVERRQSAVIPLLWVVQKQEGWVSEPAIRAIGEMLSMPRIRVYEVATFYTMFHLAPVGRHHLQVCGTTPCMLRGAEDLKAVCRKRFGGQFEVSSDGLFSWEEVECLGACANAPVVAIHDLYHEDLDAVSFEGRIDALARGDVVPPMSALKRQGSAPDGGPKTLNSPELYDGSLAAPIRLPNRPQPQPVES
jgi:NADH-quinone oxidoreductase subunit E